MIFGVLRLNGIIEQVVCELEDLDQAIEKGGGGALIFTAKDRDDFQRQKTAEQERSKPRWT